MGMKMRRGWYVTRPDGTVWWGDCPKWAAGSAMPGDKVTPIRIVGTHRLPCPGCASATGNH